jgi:iron-regulated transporter 1
MGQIGPIRASLWLASWQIICLVTGIVVFWALLDQPSIFATGLVSQHNIEPLGLRGFDLCIQIIIQEVSYLQMSSFWFLPVFIYELI